MFAGTIVASNYVEMAQVLGESFLRHHPASRFAILVIDPVEVGPVADGIEVLRLDDLDLSDFELDLMKTIYDVMELSTAVKPSLLRTLLKSDDTVCYLDPDIFVYAPFDDVVDHVATSGILLTPHVLHPVPRDGLAISERAVMQSGVFNLGFIAVGSSASPFLDWWMERLLTDAVVDLEAHLFTDQKWIDWVPALFTHHVSRDPGMNIAWWNIDQRPLGDPQPSVDGHPVRFIHFSGYDPLQPDVLSKHQNSTPRIPHAVGMPIRELADQYGRRLIASGHIERRSAPYHWSVTAGGLRLTTSMRRLCRESVMAELQAGTSVDSLTTPLAFGPRADGFRDWLCEPVGGSPDHPLTRAERGVWQNRRDLRDIFPDIDGRSAESFRLWLSVEDDAVDQLGELAPPRCPRPADPKATDPIGSVSTQLRAHTAELVRRVSTRLPRRR